MIFCCCKNPAQIFDFGHPQNTRALDLFSACRYEFDRLPWAAPISTRAISKTKDMVIICSKYPVTPLLPLPAVCTLYPMMRSQKLRDEASPVAIKCCFKDLLPCSSCNWNLSESHTWRIEGEGRTRGGMDREWTNSKTSENEQIPGLQRNSFEIWQILNCLMRSEHRPQSYEGMHENLSNYRLLCSLLLLNVSSWLPGPMSGWYEVHVPNQKIHKSPP